VNIEARAIPAAAVLLNQHGAAQVAIVGVVREPRGGHALADAPARRERIPACGSVRRHLRGQPAFTRRARECRGNIRRRRMWRARGSDTRNGKAELDADVRPMETGQS
jgi:hypothetical protein